MCTQENSNPARSYHKSIIKEVVRCDSSESEGCVSDEDNNHQISSPHSQVSTQTTTTFSPRAKVITHRFGNTHNTSSEDISQETILFSSESSRVPRRYQCFNSKQIRSPSPCPFRKTNDQQAKTIASRRSQSIECISLPVLGGTLTDDSGAGDLEPVTTPTPKSTMPATYDIVSVFGVPPTTVALMTNRYDFDITKVEEFRNRNRRKPLKPPFKSPQTIRRNTNASSPTTRSNTIFTRIIRVLKPSTTHHIPIEPMIRHHSSQDGTNEND
jgi:hypothetical protein